MADLAEAPAARATGLGAGATRQFVTCRVGRQVYALPAELVAEVIRTPPFARVPRGPKSLLGLANLRGSVLPMTSLGALLGSGEASAGSSVQAVVLAGGSPVVIAVDRVEGLVAVEGDRLQSAEAHLAAEGGERLIGAFQTPAGALAKVLDLPSLLAASFAASSRPEARATGLERLATAQVRPDEAVRADQRRTLISFDVAGQEFAFDLEVVREVVAVSDQLVAVPGGDGAVVGVVNYRDGLLPLLSLRGLLGFPVRTHNDGAEKVVIAAVGDALVGLVADRMRSLIAADTDLIEPVPRVLAARTGGEARIGAIFRADGGARLISILAADQLFRGDVMARLGGERANRVMASLAAGGVADRKFLVFRLGDNEFGLPIEALDEVAELPERITRLPKMPAFLEGVINFRGAVLPIVDQRRRFEMPPLAERARRRLIVARSGAHRAGLIVDSVTEVLASAAEAIEPTPDLTGEAARLVGGVINLEAAGRLVLILDPAELLSRAERGLLDALEAEASRTPP